MTRRLAPVHPRDVLREEFLSRMEISQYRLAKDIGVPPRRINEIVHGARAISVDTALRLARYFGTSERFWLNLHAQHDLDVEHDRVGDRIEHEVRPRTVVPPPGEGHLIGSPVHPEPRRRAQSR